MSCLVAHNLSGLSCRWETTNETDNMATGDQTDAIQRSSEILISPHVFRTDIDTKKSSIPGC
jgi:hypothetical protein